MPNRPLLHIHMPVHNAERHLPVALDSVLADMESSGIADYKIIAANDMSTDTTPQILGEYAAHPNITVLQNRVRLGCGGTHKALIEYSMERGKPFAISFRDADDISIPGSTRQLIDELERGDAGLVSAAMLEFNGDDVDDNYARYRPDDRAEIERGLLRGHVAVWNPTTVFATDAMRKAGIEYPTPSSCDDLAFQAMMFFSGVKVANLAEPGVYYRKHEGSMTTGWKPKNALPYLQTCMGIWDIAQEYGVTPTAQDRAYVFSRTLAYLTTSEKSQFYAFFRSMYRLGDSSVKRFAEST